MPSQIIQSPWQTAALLVARLIFAGVFLMAVTFKFMGMEATAGYIAAAGFPFPLFLAWCAAILEVALVLCFLSGAFFAQAALVAAAYVLFLGFSFHGPSHWTANQDEFGFFVDHFSFVAGLLFAAVHGPGRTLAVNWAGRAGLEARRANQVLMQPGGAEIRQRFKCPIHQP